MTQCPHCQHPLDESTLEKDTVEAFDEFLTDLASLERRCPHCGGSLKSDPAGAIDPTPPTQSASKSDSTPSGESTNAEDEPVDISLSDETIDFSEDDLDDFLSEDDIKLAEDATPGGKPSESNDLDETVDFGADALDLDLNLDNISDNISDDDSEADDLGATIDLVASEDKSETEDATPILSESEEDPGATIELPDNLMTVENKTVDFSLDPDNAYDLDDEGTLDSVEELSDADLKQQAPSDDINATIDPYEATSENLDDESFALDDQPKTGQTVAKTADAVTLDMTEMTEIPVRPAERNLSIDQIGDMTSAWSSSYSPKTDATVTLKHGGEGQDIGKSTLVVRSRALREVKEPASTGADYELLEVIGSGGMGVVYSARQASVDRNVAIKMLKPEKSKAGAQRGKFMSEAVITGDLDHPNIVPIYEMGANEEGALFYSMKRVQGTPWSETLSKTSQAENVILLMKVADAVGFAHANGVIHRDLKPENVMLGEFGEVLVMDWGLALATSDFRHKQFITPPDSMGGTPAYMAPEMATGPFDRISLRSDIYLLGAILFEIVTGRAPHHGKNVRDCLIAAAQNVLVPTEARSELLTIAYRAMESEPEDRYPSVADFQSAIREYQSHSESIALATRAEEELADANKSDDYQDYSRAVFAFEESLHLWDGNTKARSGLIESQLAYAKSAHSKEDHELGTTLLDENEPTHQELLTVLRKSQRESQNRRRMLKLFKLAAASMVAILFVVITGSAVWIWNERNAALAAKDEEAIAKSAALVAKADAEEQRDIAEVARDEANTQKGRAETALVGETKARKEEKKQRTIAETALEGEKAALVEEKAQREAADEQRKRAVTAEGVAVRERNEANKQRDNAVAAKAAEEEQAYIARIGLADAKTEENAFSDALRLLDYYLPEQHPELANLRHWEWGRLRYLAGLSSQEFDAQSPVDAVAVSTDGSRFASGSRDGKVRVWDAQNGKVTQEFLLGKSYIFSLAFSPNGSQLAVGSSSPDGVLTVWDVASGRKLQTFSGHKDAVLSVAFSRDGKRLLSSSYDGTAKLWNLQQADQPIRDFVGHNGWVWSAAFAPDEKTMVTASQDGAAVIWAVEGEQAAVGHLRRFLGHEGPVLTAVFSPDGKQIASGGYDRRVLLWNADETQPFDLQAVARGDIVEPQKFRDLDAHTAEVRSLVFASSGKQLISAGQDNTVRVWNLETDELLDTLRGHSQRVTEVVFMPDGKHLLSASHDQHIKRWSLADYRETRLLEARRLSAHEDAVLGAAFSSDGSQIVTASRDRSARVWDTRSGKPLQILSEGHAFLASAARFFPAGDRLITAAGDNSARVWDVKTGVQLFDLTGAGRAAAVALSHDGKRILTGSNDQRPRLWNAQTGELLPPISPEFGADHQAEVSAVAFSADDRTLFTGDEQGRGFLWDAKTGKRLAAIGGHSSGITVAYFLDDGSRLLTASADGTVSQWNTTTGAEITNAALAHSDAVEAMAISPDGSRVLTACADGVVRLWNIQSGVIEMSCGDSESSATLRPLGVAFSPNGREALITTSDNRVRLWKLEPAGVNGTNTAPWPKVAIDLAAQGQLAWSAIYAPDGAKILTIGGNGARLWDVVTKQESLRFSPHAAVASASFSPDGQRVVTGSWDNSAKVWDLKTSRAVMKLKGAHSGHVNSAVFAPGADANVVLTASDDGTAKLWNLTTGKVTQTLAGHTDRVRMAVFAADGRTIVTASADGTARVWDTATGATIHTLAGHDAGVLSVTVSQDGSRIATGASDARVQLWDGATGRKIELITPLEGHTAGVTSLAFSPDGKRLLTGSQDGVAKLWDASSGREILTLRGHSREVTGVAFSPDGLTILTSSRDGSAVLWPAVDWRE